MAGRKGDQFSINANAEREKFEYRILVDDSPVTMNIGSKPLNGSRWTSIPS